MQHFDSKTPEIPQPILERFDALLKLLALHVFLTPDRYLPSQRQVWRWGMTPRWAHF